MKIFELLYKFGSNLGIYTSGNSVIIVNSTRGRHLTDGELLLASRRAHGHLRLRAGEEKAAAWLLRSSWPRFKAETPSPPFSVSSSVFPVATAQLRRARAVAVAHSRSQPSLPQLRLLLANPADRS